MTDAARRSAYKGDRVRKPIFIRRPLLAVVQALAEQRGITDSSFILEAVAAKVRRPDLA